MPKDVPEMDAETIAAQRAVFEQVVRAGENYLLALTHAIYVGAIAGPDNMPHEIRSTLNTARKQALDLLQSTLMSKL